MCRCAKSLRWSSSAAPSPRTSTGAVPVIARIIDRSCGARSHSASFSVWNLPRPSRCEWMYLTSPSSLLSISDFSFTKAGWKRSTCPVMKMRLCARADGHGTLRVGDGQRDRLFDQHVLAVLDRPDRELGMELRRQRHDDGVDVVARDKSPRAGWPGNPARWQSLRRGHGWRPKPHAARRATSACGCGCCPNIRNQEQRRAVSFSLCSDQKWRRHSGAGPRTQPRRIAARFAAKDFHTIVRGVRETRIPTRADANPRCTASRRRPAFGGLRNRGGLCLTGPPSQPYIPRDLGERLDPPFEFGQASGLSPPWRGSSVG